MNNFTNILNESTKSNFNTSVSIELENGLIIEGTFIINDYALSYAKDTASRLLESNIKKVNIQNIELLK